MLALPFSLFLYAAVLFGTGYSPAMPLVVATGSFCIQTHFGTLPCTASLTVASSILFAKRHYDTPQPSRRSVLPWIGVTCLVLIPVWLPPLLEQFHTFPGNPRAFIGYVRSSSSDMRWADSAAILAAKVSWADLLANATGLSLPTRLFQVISFTLLLLQLGAAVALYYSKSVCSVCRSLAIVTLVGIFSGFVSVANIRMGAYDFLTDWMSAIGLVGYSSLAIASVSSRWRMTSIGAERRRDAPLYGENLRYILPTVLAILLLIVTGTAITNALSWSGESTPRGSVRVRDLSQKLISYLEKRDFRRPNILVNPDRFNWAVTTGIGLEVLKANRRFSLESNRLRSDVRPSRADDAVILVTDRPCSDELCITIVSDMRPESDTSVTPEDRATFVSSVEVPSEISAQRLAQSLGHLFNTQGMTIPSPLAELAWSVVNSPEANGKIVYSMGSGPYQLKALQQVSLFQSPGGLRIVSRGYDPRLVTRSLDLQRDNVYFLLLDVSLDHDDLGGVFYGRPSQVFERTRQHSLCSKDGIGWAFRFPLPERLSGFGSTLDTGGEPV